MPQVGRMTRTRFSALTLVLVLVVAPSPIASAGGFRTGTYQTKESSSSHRNVISGMEEIRSERSYANTINGTSRVDHIGLTMQADGFTFSRQINQLDASLGANGLSRDLSAAGIIQSELLQWSESTSASSGNSADHDLSLQMPGISLESLLSEQASQRLGTDVSGSQSFSGGAINLQASDSSTRSVLESLQMGEQIGLNGSLDLRI